MTATEEGFNVRNRATELAGAADLLYGEKMSALADLYWREKWAGRAANARAVLETMNNVEPDRAPAEASAGQSIADELGPMSLTYDRNEALRHVWRGGTLDESGYAWNKLRGAGWRHVEAGADEYYVWYVMRDVEGGGKALLSYCEGDITLAYFADPSDYLAELRQILAFHRDD